MFGLFPEHVQDGYPRGEIPQSAEVFTNQYQKVNGECSFGYQEDG